MSLLQTRRRSPGRPWLAVIVFWTMWAWLVLVFFNMFYRVRRLGMERVPRTGPLIYVSNHQSHYDPPLVGVAIYDRPFASMARASLFSFAPFAWLIRTLGAVPLSREASGGKAAIAAALKELEAGRCVLLFPEGTRSRDGVPGEFHRGFMLLVKRSGARVVPVAVEGAHEVWPSGRSWPRLTGRLIVEVGEPIDAAELLAPEPDVAVELVKRRIETMRLQLRLALRDATGGRFPPPGPADRAYWESERTDPPVAAPGGQTTATPHADARRTRPGG